MRGWGVLLQADLVAFLLVLDEYNEGYAVISICLLAKDANRSFFSLKFSSLRWHYNYR